MTNWPSLVLPRHSLGFKRGQRWIWPAPSRPTGKLFPYRFAEVPNAPYLERSCGLGTLQFEIDFSASQFRETDAFPQWCVDVEMIRRSHSRRLRNERWWDPEWLKSRTIAYFFNLHSVSHTHTYTHTPDFAYLDFLQPRCVKGLPYVKASWRSAYINGGCLLHFRLKFNPSAVQEGASPEGPSFLPWRESMGFLKLFSFKSWSVQFQLLLACQFPRFYLAILSGMVQ